jgi:hypothetical protein
MIEEIKKYLSKEEVEKYELFIKQETIGKCKNGRRNYTNYSNVGNKKKNSVV